MLVQAPSHRHARVQLHCPALPLPGLVTALRQLQIEEVGVGTDLWREHERVRRVSAVAIRSGVVGVHAGHLRELGQVRVDVKEGVGAAETPVERIGRGGGSLRVRLERIVVVFGADYEEEARYVGLVFGELLGHEDHEREGWSGVGVVGVGGGELVLVVGWLEGRGA